MKLIDISREFFSSQRAPGCAVPSLERIAEIAAGSPYNYTHIHGSVHTATHCDAALHFVDGAADISHTALTYFVGSCYVMTVPPDKLITALDLEHIPAGVTRLLLHGGGNAHLSKAAVDLLIRRGIITVGIDAFSVGAVENDTEVHVALLSRRVAIIENLDLEHVEDGEYFLSAAPCKFGGAEAAFCRAILISGLQAQKGET